MLDLNKLPPTTTSLMVVPWDDPVVDAVGYDVRSQYVELFWLNVLGPTATWILRRLVQGFDRWPLGYELDLAEISGAMGLGYAAGATGKPFMRALQRCVMFGAAQPVPGDALAVRRRMPPVAARHLQRMPDALRAVHASWSAHPSAIAHDEERARTLAAAMVASGDDTELVERQLLAVGVSPTAAVRAADALRSSTAVGTASPAR